MPAFFVLFALPLRDRFLSVVVIRERAVCWFLHRVLPDRIERDLDRFFELRVAALTPELRIEVDLDIRSDAFVLNVKFSLRVSERDTRSRYRTAVDEHRIAIDADKAAPRPLPD